MENSDSDGDTMSRYLSLAANGTKVTADSLWLFGCNNKFSVDVI